MISVNTMSWAAGNVGAESISAPISAPVSFLADMDGADMESAPTFVNMVWHNDKFMQLNIVDVLIAILIYLCFPLRHALTFCTFYIEFYRV